MHTRKVFTTFELPFSLGYQFFTDKKLGFNLQTDMYLIISGMENIKQVSPGMKLPMQKDIGWEVLQ